jgi:16S rRNA processing protein RimM
MNSPQEPAQLPQDAVEVATVVDAWGVKGWIKVLPHSSDPQALFSSTRWYFVPVPQSPSEPERVSLMVVRQVRPHSGLLVALVDGIDDRESALGLRGARIFIARSSFPTPADDEYYWVDLIGLRVINREGAELGTVAALHPTGSHAVLVLDHLGADGQPSQRMIPFVAAYVDAVDLAERRITVDWHPDY